jgi:hypothetical protein
MSIESAGAPYDLVIVSVDPDGTQHRPEYLTIEEQIENEFGVVVDSPDLEGDGSTDDT